MSKKRKLRWLSRAVSFFRNVTSRQKDELDIAAEVSAHLELLIEEKVRSCGYPWTEMFCGSWDFLQ